MKRRLGKVQVSNYFLYEKLEFFEEHLPDFNVVLKIPKDENTTICIGFHPKFEKTEAYLQDAPEYSFIWNMKYNDSDHTVIMECVKQEDKLLLNSF